MTEKLIVIPAQAGIHPFAIFPFARSANGNLLPKMANHCGGESRRELDGDFISPSFSRLRESNRAFGAVIIAQAIIAAFLLFDAAFCGATHSRIFPSCFARWFALRANSKNAAIIACAIMTAPKARLDSRSRENDGDIKSPSNSRRLSPPQWFAIFGNKLPFALRANGKMAKGWIPACAGMTINFSVIPAFAGINYIIS